jgi:nucleotide-binding universal stress UspA family protein
VFGKSPWNDVALMMTFRSILCPIDFSSHSREALQHAVAIAKRFGGRVAVMFVEDPLLAAAMSGSSARKLIARTRIELERFVTRSIAPLRPVQNEIAHVVATGNPADEILRAAKRSRSDLIVIGTQGLSGFRKLFFGSTTEQVLRQVDIPVLAIPPSKRSRSKGAHPMTIGRVIAPLDLTGEWQSDAMRAAKVAAAFGAELLLVHVLTPIQAPPWLGSAARGTDRQRVERARAALDRIATRLSSDHEISCRVVTGNPADEIAKLSKGATSLAVMSLREDSGVWGARRGSIAYRVLTHSSTPVLALPRRRLRVRS